MSVTIRDTSLEEEIERERVRRNHGTKARTIKDLVKERLLQIQLNQDPFRPTSPQKGRRVAEPSAA